MLIVYHIFIFILFIVQPLYGYYSYKQYLKQIEAGNPLDTIKMYKETMILEWVAFAILLTTFYIYGQSTIELGFKSSNSTQFFIGLGILVLLAGGLSYTIKLVRGMTDTEKNNQLDSGGNLIHFLPKNKLDYKYFIMISITAGIVEETLYRGFVYWYLSSYMPIWVIIILSSVIFGLAHTYQGVGGVIKVTVVGIVFGIIYVITGSIWFPILAHILLDVLQGAMMLELTQRTDKQEKVLTT